MWDIITVYSSLCIVTTEPHYLLAPLTLGLSQGQPSVNLKNHMIARVYTLRGIPIYCVVLCCVVLYLLCEV